MGKSIIDSKETKTHNSDTSIQLLVIFVNIYKHHFDLFIKGYTIYLAIIGVTASILFRNETFVTYKIFLTIFLIVVSLLGNGIWFLGLNWVFRFEKQIRIICENANSPVLDLFGFKFTLIMGLLASIIITAANIILLQTIKAIG